MNSIVIPNEIMLAEVTAMLAEGHPVQILTKGCSMLPYIKGDSDSVRLVKAESYKVGDAVLAQIRPGVYVLHRIKAIDGDRVTLKGDGNLSSTETCTLAHISGKVEKIISAKGKERDDSPKRAMRWGRHPLIVRRLYLAVFRRLI